VAAGRAGQDGLGMSIAHTHLGNSLHKSRNVSSPDNMEREKERI
jgi:hypothetical protein